MPKETFLNLAEDKRKRITDAFLKEFTLNSFDDASITAVVKELGIAKGSIYQYFNDKLDLFMYLIQECSSVKMKYLVTAERKNFPDYWSYFRNLYECGFQFDKENPMESHFLHSLVQNLNSPSVQNMYDKMKEQTVETFINMAEYEISLGLFRSDIPIKTMGFMLYKIGSSIMEQLEYSNIINPTESIKSKTSVYQGKKKALMDMVDNYIELIKYSFDKN